jgi:hypothetical protein
MSALLAALALWYASNASGMESVLQVALAERPDDPSGNNAAMAHAIAEAGRQIAARSAETVVLLLPVGTFPFAFLDAPGVGIEDFDPGDGHLIIRGAGEDQTTLIFEVPEQRGVTRDVFFMIRRARGITLEHLHLTRSRISTSQGTVESLGEQTIRFRLHEGFPDPEMILAGAGRNERTLVAYRHEDPLDPTFAPYATKYHVLGIGKVPGDEKLFEASINERQELQRVHVGDWVTLKVKAGGDTVFFEDASDCTVRNVRFTRAAVRPIAGIGQNHDLLIERVQCLRPEPINGRGACYSSPGGGIILQAGARGNLTIRDCTIVGTADDGIAVFSTARAPRGNPAPQSPASNITIEENSVRDNHGRGVLICQSLRGICRNNTFLRCDGPSILVKNEDIGNCAPMRRTTPSSAPPAATRSPVPATF